MVGRLGLPSFLDSWSTCSRLALSEGPVSASYEPQVCPLASGSEVSQSRPTLCDPMDCSLLGFSVHGIFQARISLLGFSVHGIFQARILERVAISFSRGSSWPRDRTQVSCIVGRRFTLWATREALGLGRDLSTVPLMTWAPTRRQECC